MKKLKVVKRYEITVDDVLLSVEDWMKKLNEVVNGVKQELKDEDVDFTKITLISITTQFDNTVVELSAWNEVEELESPKNDEAEKELLLSLLEKHGLPESWSKGELNG